MVWLNNLFEEPLSYRKRRFAQATGGRPFAFFKLRRIAAAFDRPGFAAGRGAPVAKRNSRPRRGSVQSHWPNLTCYNIWIATRRTVRRVILAFASSGLLMGTTHRILINRSLRALEINAKFIHQAVWNFAVTQSGRDRATLPGSRTSRLALRIRRPPQAKAG